MNKEELKKQLIAIKNNNWDIPSRIDPYDLSLEMLNNIGSVDSVLRDNLIFSAFMKIILNKKISYCQMKELLYLCISEEHLFNGVGKTYDDSVFNRTFTILVIQAIIEMNNEAEQPFLNKEEIKDVFDSVVKYSQMEKDFRGYVEGKGWAHSTAHTSDALCSLAESEFIKEEELRVILSIIKDKICIDTYTYINEEEERLINTFISIYKRNIIKDDEIIEWMQSFKSVNGKGVYPNEEHLRENRKLFFRGLYFRVKKLNLEEVLIKPIEEVLESLPAFY